MRAAIGLRLLLALTLMGWGQLALFKFISFSRYFFVFSLVALPIYSYASSPVAVYVRPGHSTPNWPTAEAACKALYGSTAYVAFQVGCYAPPSGNYLGSVQKIHICTTGTLDPATNQCVVPEPPKDCSSHNGKFIIAAVSGSQAGSAYSTPGTVSIDGARYVSAPDGNTRCKPNFDGSGTAICAARYGGDGSCMPSGHSESDDLTEGTFVDVTDTSTGDEKCLTFGGKELCLSPDNAGCDVYNGNPWCYQTGDNCGEVTEPGTTQSKFVCFPKTARQCTYANGKMECIETGNPPGSKPPAYITPTSSDHPYNGGNADGNDKNDPKAPGAGDDTQYVGGGGPPTDLSQTNDELRGLGEKLDESTGLLEDIKDLLTGDGDDSGNSDGSAADAEAEGAAVGNQIGDAITTQMEAVDEERNEEVEGVLDELPNQVSQWFGADGSAVGLDFIDSILPAPVACAEYVVPFSIKGYTAHITLPVCALMPYKPILEWVIYCLTAIGAWRIGYSALRQEDAKAAKGGF